MPHFDNSKEGYVENTFLDKGWGKTKIYPNTMPHSTPLAFVRKTLPLFWFCQNVAQQGSLSVVLLHPTELDPL
jgi:hypothetical protein